MTGGKPIIALVLISALGSGLIFFNVWWSDKGSGIESPPILGRYSGPDHPDSLPQFRLPTLDGQEIASDHWVGKVLVLNFWATWCPPCLRELPLFDELQRTHADADLQVVGIAVDNRKDVERFLTEHPVGFPILLGDTTAIELSRQMGNRVQGLPFTAIFDSRGKWVYGHAGEMSRAVLTEQLEPLLTRLDRK